MDKFLSNLQTFENEFGTEKKCLDYLFALRWPNGYSCPRCQHNEKYDITEFKYKCAGCYYQTTVTALTNFHDTRVPINKWFLAVWHFVSSANGISVIELQKLVGLGSNNTARLMLYKFKKIMIKYEQQRLCKLDKQEELQDTVILAQTSINTRFGRATISIFGEVNKTKIGRIHILDKSEPCLSRNTANKNNVEPIISEDGRPLSKCDALRYVAAVNYNSRTDDAFLKLDYWLLKNSSAFSDKNPLFKILEIYCLKHNSEKFRITKESFHTILHGLIQPKNIY